MRSQVRFFMNTADERAFIQVVVAEPETVLVIGPPWSSPEVPLLDPAHLPASYYVLIWNRREVPKLKAKRIEERWEVANEENLTIQFLRSQSWNNQILCEPNRRPRTPRRSLIFYLDGREGPIAQERLR